MCWVFVSVRGLSLVAASGGHSSSRCAGLSLSRPLLLRSTGSRRAGSVIVAHGPSCSAACGIFPDQSLNPCPLHWQADSQPLRHQGSPSSVSQPQNPWHFGPDTRVRGSDPPCSGKSGYPQCLCILGFDQPGIMYYLSIYYWKKNSCINGTHSLNFCYSRVSCDSFLWGVGGQYCVLYQYDI